MGLLSVAGFVIVTYLLRPNPATNPVSQDQVSGRKLTGPSEINASFESLAAHCSKRLQLLVQVLGERPHLPETLATTIARRIDETNRRGVPIKYDPILVFDTNHISKEFMDGLAKRQEVFTQRGVAQFVRPRYLHQRDIIG